MRRRASLLAVALLLGACSSPPPPPPKEDLALLARLAALETKLEDQERARTNLLVRLAALEARAGTKPRPDDDLAARIAAIESKLGALEDRVAANEMARSVAAEPEERGVQILDRKKEGAERRDRGPKPGPGEVVKPLAAISGDTFSYLRDKKVDLARLAGIEAPARDDEAAAAKARDRLEEVVTSGELTFEYPAGAAPEARAIVVYARVKRRDGSEVMANEVLLREGLVRARGEHPRREDFEKLEAEAKAARLGLFGR